MATNTYKTGLSRLRERSLSSKQRAGIYASRCLYDPINHNNTFEENPDTVERKKYKVE